MINDKYCMNIDKGSELGKIEVDILLINPPFSRLKGSSYDIHFHMNIGYLAAALRDVGIVKIYNAEDPLRLKEDAGSASPLVVAKDYDSLFEHAKNYKRALDDDIHPVWKEIRYVFSRLKPKIIGITCMSAKYPAALKVARIYKECIPNGIVVMGGQHPTIKPEEVLACKDVDFVVRGEGEQTIKELVSALLNGKRSGDDISKIKGVSLMKYGRIVHTETRELLNNLDDLKFPGRDLLLKPLDDMAGYGAIVTTRGCPFECAFCSAKSVVGKKVRRRSIGNVVEEIKEVMQIYKINKFFFWDDTFTVDRSRAIELCNAVKPLKIEWGCTTRVDMVDPALLKDMKRAGCVSIDYGVESGSDRLLAKIYKNITIARVEKAIMDTIMARILPAAFLMVGFPDETEADIMDTIKFVEKTNAFYLGLSIFTPYPGTRLFERANELGLIQADFDWRNISHQSFENFFTQSISHDRFLAVLKKLITSIDKHNASARIRIMRWLILAFNKPKRIINKLWAILKLDRYLNDK